MNISPKSSVILEQNAMLRCHAVEAKTLDEARGKRHAEEAQSMGIPTRGLRALVKGYRC
jgi:hypothetical protein